MRVCVRSRVQPRYNTVSMTDLTLRPTLRPTLRENVHVRTLASAVLGVCLGVALAGCDQKQAAGNEQQPGIPVKNSVIAPVAIPESSEYLGTLKSRHSVMLNPQVEGQVTGIFVKSGDRVKAGTALMQIDPLTEQPTAEPQEPSAPAP